MGQGDGQPVGIDPTLPVLLPPPEQRIATAADVTESENRMRREMKLWLLAGGALGQGLAALLATLVATRNAPQQVEQALTSLLSLL